MDSISHYVIRMLFLRDRTNQLYQDEQRSRRLEGKNPNTDSENNVEKIPEDLAGKVCYELEPLVDSL